MTARRKDLGVVVVFRCPTCHDEHEETLAAGYGHYPGQVIDEPHLPGFCSPPDLSVTFTEVHPSVMNLIAGRCLVCGGGVVDGGRCRNEQCWNDQLTRMKD